MKVCPNCQYNNREGILFCEDCGQSLTGTVSTLTRELKKNETGQLNLKSSSWGTARFNKQASIIIHVRDVPEPIVMQPLAQMVMGRADSSQTPDLDLTNYGAQEKGVSRVHAAIRRGDDTLTLVDLGSVNGTHLNGQRLIPNQPRILRDGDEVRLGKLVLHIYFKGIRHSSGNEG